MRVTEVQFKAHTKGNLRGFCDVTLDDELVIHNVRILAGSNGLYINFPNRHCSDGEWRDIVHPIKSNLRDAITKAVLDKAGPLEKNNTQGSSARNPEEDDAWS